MSPNAIKVFWRRIFPLFYIVIRIWAAEGPIGNLSGPQPIKAEGIDNFFKLSDHIYSGAAPEGDAAFVELKKLGVTTLLSVDGSKPNVELAHKYGLRYVHLPHGYNGIGTNVQAALIKASQEISGPIFVHCHHGKHRGPTAAAVMCMGTEGWDTKRATEWLNTAGTATNYAGLFMTVRDFRSPSAAELKKLPSKFPEIAEPVGLVEAMVAIDEQWDHLQEIRKAAYNPLKDGSDYDPANGAVILWEHFREAQRLPESIDRGESFLERMKAAEEQGKNIETLLRQIKPEKRAELRPQLDEAVDALGKSCAVCHKSSRDPAVGRFK